MIATVLVTLLALAGLAFVLVPLARGAVRESDDAPSPVDEARDKKLSALAGIVDLEQERDAGKMSPEDFRSLRSEYERDALEALNELDRLGTDPADDELEREIAAARQKLACPSCGAPRTTGEPCPRCGA